MTTTALPSGARILERCEALARCSEQPDALTRVYLSAEQRAANELVLAWMREAGMSARLDAIGNVVGRYDGDRPGAPCLMLGSHLDTVRDAGKYDGMLGVVAGIECVASLHASGRRLPFAVEVVGFADEEGVRFNATLLGSRAVAGTFDIANLDRVDVTGKSMRDAMRDFGLDPTAIASAARHRDEVLAYAELHIEQGPVLEDEGLALGVVTAINGGNRFAIELARDGRPCGNSADASAARHAGRSGRVRARRGTDLRRRAGTRGDGRQDRSAARRDQRHSRARRGFRSTCVHPPTVSANARSRSFASAFAEIAQRRRVDLEHQAGVGRENLGVRTVAAGPIRGRDRKPSTCRCGTCRPVRDTTAWR